MIRRLDNDTDHNLLVAAYAWDDGAPRWRKDCEAAWGITNLADFLAAAKSPRRLNAGIFSGNSMVGLIMLTLAAKDTYDSDIAAKRGTPLAVLVAGTRNLTAQMFHDHNMREAFTFTPTCNRAILNLLNRVGFTPDGLTVLKGQTHGKCIEWRRSSIRREDIEFTNV